MTMIKNSMISLEREGEGFERFLDDDGREFDDFFRTQIACIKFKFKFKFKCIKFKFKFREILR